MWLGHLQVSQSSADSQHITSRKGPQQKVRYIPNNIDDIIWHISHRLWSWWSPNSTMALWLNKQLLESLHSVNAEHCRTADFYSSSLRSHPESTSLSTLASCSRMDFIPTGGAGVLLCTWLPGIRSAACLWPRCMSVTALFDYIWHSS